MAEKILVTRSSMPAFDEYTEEIKDIWESHWLTNMGPKHQKLQSMLKEYMGVENVDLFTNGHMAIELSLQALGLTGEVITTPFTFASTTHAIVRNGLEPVFCDIKADDYTIDTDKIESLVTEKTSAIMPVHVYGNVCDTEKIREIADKYNLKVIYDAAHTFGEEYKGRGIGSFGDVSCFSFHATKVFNSIEGGCVCVGDSDFGKRLYALKNFGITSPEDVDYIGANAKMNEFCAAMGICNLRHLDGESENRKKVVERYISNLENTEGIKLNRVQKDVKSNYAYFPIMIDEKVFGAGRNEVFAKLAENDIIARKYFYPLTNTFGAFGGKYDTSKTPTALYVSQRVLTLPLYADLSLENVDRICEVIVNCKK